MTSLTSEELDQRITASIAHATTELRDEFRAQLLEVRRGQDSRLLLEGLRKIDAAESQADVLKALLLATEPYAPGAAVLLNTPQGLRGWGMRGGHGNAGIESVALPVDGASPWGRVVAGDGVVRGGVSDLYAALGDTAGEEHILVPLMLRGQVAAILATEGGDDVPALQALTYGASQAIETLAVRATGPSPTLGSAESAATMSTDATSSTITSIGPMTPETGGPPPAPPLQAAPVGVGTEPAVTESWAEGPIEPIVEPAPAIPAETPAAQIAEPQVTEPQTAQPAPSPFHDDLQTVAVTPETIEGSAQAPTTEVSPPSGSDALAMGADGQIIPPDDVEGPGWAFSSKSQEESESGESAVHDEARRLARLLVSEIKLYNEEQVEEGRQNRNIYSRLREDIDRSKQIYEERIHPSIRGKTDFFRDELVRILAAGDPDALGM